MRYHHPLYGHGTLEAQLPESPQNLGRYAQVFKIILCAAVPEGFLFGGHRHPLGGVQFILHNFYLLFPYKHAKLLKDFQTRPIPGPLSAK